MNNSEKANGSHIQSWENIFDQTSGYIDVYIFIRSSVICGLVNYIFLTLYVGGKCAGNFWHPLRGYFVINFPLGFLMHFPEKQVW